MPRTSMTAVIAQLRQHGQAATDDIFDGITYWTDDQLQQLADKNSRISQLRITRANAAYTIFRAVMPKSYMLEDEFLLFDAQGVAVTGGTPTYNPDTQEITFLTAQTVPDLYLEARQINVYNALAELWQQKAEQRFNYIDWKAQNNKMNMGQEYQHCLDRAAYYRAKTVRTFKRGGEGKWWS